LPILLFLSCALSLPAAEETGLAPVPQDAAQQQVAELIRQLYAEEYAGAKKISERCAFAEKLLAQATESRDGVERFVLLRVAREMAIEAGDAEKVFLAIDRMASDYRVDPWQMKREAAASLTETIKFAAQHKALAEALLRLIDEMTGSDAYDSTAELVEMAEAPALKCREAAVRQEVATQKERLERLTRAYGEIRTALATLDRKPADPQANLAVGIYHCFHKGDWQRGLSMLALGENDPIATLAWNELKGPVSPSEKLDLADGWWEAADQQAKSVKAAIQEHAAGWYRSALPGLAASERQRVEARLREYDGLPDSPLESTPVEFTRALAFDGKNGYVLVPHIPFDESPTFTLEAWVKGWQGNLLCQGTQGDPENEFYLRQTDNEVAVFWESGRGADNNRQARIGPSQQWRHVAIVYEAGRLRIFVDGTLAFAGGTPPPGPFKRNRPMKIAAKSLGGVKVSLGSGMLASLRISNVARYDAGFTPPQEMLRDHNTALLYDASHFRANVLQDLSGFDRHGVLYAVQSIEIK
jgi:hypothetical protein